MIHLDIDECQSDPCNAKDDTATCIDALNGYTCACSADWTDVDCTLGISQIFNKCN